MDKNRLRLLFDKYLAGTLDETEHKEFDALMSAMEESAFSDLVDESLDPVANKNFGQDEVFQKINLRIADKATEEPVVVKPLYNKWRHLGKIAALILMAGLLGVALYRIEDKDTSKEKLADLPAAAQRDIELPEEEAMITLADGKQLSLSDLGKDTLRYTGVALLRADNGTIVIQRDKRSGFFGAERKHRFKTPKGTTLRLALPDGSIVDLNSDSQMEIYASFGDKQREVDLSGEAFFEVAHDQASPFIVHAKNTAVTVLGTRFNMSAYQEDKNVATTLLSGSVQVDAAKNRLRITPGQQANVDRSAKIQLENKVDIDRILAWRDGYFRFKDEPIHRIMEDLAKWYPIADVEFKAGSTDRFTGSLKRSKKLSDVLASIQQVSDLRFDIQEGRVIVMK